MPPDV
jgi:hypothetical protein